MPEPHSTRTDWLIGELKTLPRDVPLIVTLYHLPYSADDHHGFLRLTVESSTIVGDYYQVPRPQEPRSKGNQLMDYFQYDWHNKKYVRNKL